MFFVFYRYLLCLNAKIIAIQRNKDNFFLYTDLNGLIIDKVYFHALDTSYLSSVSIELDIWKERR